MNFKFDSKKIKADMTANLGYAQKGATKFVDTVKAGGQEAKSMFNKSSAGKKINAHGKGMMNSKVGQKGKQLLTSGINLAKKNPKIAAGIFVTTAAVGVGKKIKKRRNS